MFNPNKWDIQNPKDDGLETEPSGEINELKKYKLKEGKERGLVTKTLLFTACSILLLTLFWGMGTGDYVPMEKTKETVAIILSCIVGFYYGSQS